MTAICIGSLGIIEKWHETRAKEDFLEEVSEPSLTHYMGISQAKEIRTTLAWGRMVFR